MADDIPIYQQKTAVQPGGNLPAVGSALGKKPGYEPALDKSLADFDYYTNYAASAAQELGATLGKDRGQKPGGFLVPPIFESQKSFHQAYKEEEFQNLAFEGQQSLKKMQILASRNPTKASLATYQKEGTKVIEELLEISSPGNQADLKRGLKGIYENGALNVAEANYKKERDEMKAQANVRFDESTKSAYNNAFTGNKELSEQDRNIAMRNIDGMVQSGLINGEEAYKRLDIIENAQKMGDLHSKVQEWTKDGTYAEKIRQFAENRPESMTPLKHQEYLGSMMQVHGQYQAALNADQQLTYMSTLNQIQGGIQLSPSQLEDAKAQMGPQNALKLDHDILQLNKKANDTVKLVNDMTPDFGDVVKMSKWSDGEVDKVFNHYLAGAAAQAGVQPDEIPLTAQAQLAAGFGAPVKGFTDKLENAVRYGDAGTATEAARAIRTLNNNNPITVSKLDNNAKATAGLYDLYARNTSITGEEALKAARNEVYNIDDNTKKQRLEGLKQWYSDNKLNDYNVKLKRIAEGLGATEGWFGTGLFAKGKKELVPAGLTTVVDGLVQSMAQRTPNPEMAWTMAMDELKKTYKETDTNNRKEIMALAPETVLPGNSVWQQNDKIKAIKDMVDRNKELREKNGFVYNELDWPDAPDTENLIDKLLVEGDIKINVDGKPSKIVIVSDVVTQLSPTQQPSWQLNYIDEKGMQIPLMDMNGANAVARWVPDIKGLESQVKKRNDRLLTSAKALKEARGDVRDVYRNPITELGID